ncbi:MAG: 3-deoxy-manno-octulosonate cytidylyltransferase, partial [Deltaproteobacteria bacterium]|nr:3-deoxy-manno-octulosonate cytidylyltransferase [Deltaproteobacteria bacterium]
MGIYLFRADFLQQFARMTPTPLAEREQLEQLRALENGFSIHCFQANTFGVGVDVPGDIQKAEKLLSAQKQSP